MGSHLRSNPFGGTQTGTGKKSTGVVEGDLAKKGETKPRRKPNRHINNGW